MLVFARDGVLYRQPFDGQALSGEPMRLGDVAYRAISLQALFDVSMDGRVLISSPPSASTQHLTWFDRTGANKGTMGPPGQFQQPRISPDGRRVIFNRPDDNGGNRDLWMIETGRGVAGRLTTDPANEWNEFWTFDGRRVIFSSDRNGHLAGSGWEKTSLDAGAGEQPIEGVPNWGNPEDITADGRWITFTNGATHGDIWIVPTFGDRKPFRFLDSGFDDRIPRFSPDGKWITYHSNESGRFEVYVRPFAGAPAESGRKTQVSLQGGFYATWVRSGEELFYLGPDSRLYVADMKGFARSGSIPTSRPLFTTCAGSAPTGSATQGSGFDVSPEGSRVLFVCSDALTNRNIVTVNWQAEANALR
jgi:serine/threonine-protein kinase